VSVVADGLSWTMSPVTLMLIARAVFLLRTRTNGQANSPDQIIFGLNTASRVIEWQPTSDIFSSLRTTEQFANQSWRSFLETRCTLHRIGRSRVCILSALRGTISANRLTSVSRNYRPSPPSSRAIVGRISNSMQPEESALGRNADPRRSGRTQTL